MVTRLPRAARRILAGLLALACLPGVGAAEAKLELPDPLVPGVVLEGAIKVEDAAAGVANVTLPPVAGLEWQVQTGRMSSTSIINGVVTRSETVRLAVRAQMADTLSVPAVTVTLSDGSTLTTAPLTVAAHAANQNLQGDAFAETAFEPAAIVAGEPTTLVYRVYLRQNNDRPRALRQCDLAPPAGALPLGERSDSEGQTYDARGNPWRVHTYRWPLTWALPGAYQAGGQQAYVICRQDFFGQLSPIADRSVAIRPATLTVAALPEAGRPADFSGLFGPLTISAALERPRIASGEGTVLTVTIEGRQTELVTRPALAVPAGLKAYPKDDDAPARSGAGARDQRPLGAVPGPHQRSFRWDIVPERAGDFALPALTLAYFDPASRAYDHAHGPALTLTVLPGRAGTVSITGTPLSEAPGTPAGPQLLLPAPLRGGAPPRPGAALGLLVLGAAFVGGALVGLAGRWRARRPDRPHRGRALRRAAAAGDLEALAAAIHELLQVLPPGPAAASAARLAERIDLARFGGAPLGDVGDLVAVLEGVP